MPHYPGTTTTATSRLHPRPPTSTSSRTQSLHHHSNYPNSISFEPQPQSSPLRSRLAPLLPISRYPNISCSDPPNKHNSQQPNTSLLKTWAGKAAVVVLGSAVFAGAFGLRPSLSLPGARATVLEEKVGDEEGYVRLLERNPGDLEALKMAFYGEMRKGKAAEAVKYVERLRDVEPGEVEWRLLQALSYELTGELGKAKRMFQDVLEERPLLVRALHGLALVLHKNHEGPAVFEMLNKALELARCEQRVAEERNIQILIAQMHVVKGDLEGGLKRFQELVNENPRDFRPFLCQGIIYSLLDKKKEADEEFEIYRSLVPDEFPQRGFLDDVVVAAKTESQEHMKNEFESEFSFKK